MVSAIWVLNPFHDTFAKNDCDKIYIGKTKRNIHIRAKEHIRNIKFFQIDKSAVAASILIVGGICVPKMNNLGEKL